MFKTTLMALIASSAMVSAVVIPSADADAAGKRRGSAFSASPVIMKADPRRTTIKKRSTGKFGVPAQSAGQPLGADWMAGVCNSAGGGASSNPDGTVSCVDPDGNDVLDPVPAPD
jgi:hypothetical protein